MKFQTAIVQIIAAAALILGVAAPCPAFHDGGVGSCEGCHTMHNSENGIAQTTNGKATQFNGNPSLLLASDPGSVCLNCHKGDTADYHVLSNATGPSGLPGIMTPGGDFAWLNISTSYMTSAGTAGYNAGSHHGHDIVAADYGLLPSPDYVTAPGGSYPSAGLSCISCHDPHGRYRVNGQYQVVGPAAGQNAGAISASGSYGKQLPTATESVGTYRLLAGTGYLPQSLQTTPALAFINQAPFAFSPASYNRSEALTDTRVAYGSGMSEWCENCHTLSQLHTAPTSSVNGHPSGNNINAALSNPDYASTTGETVAAVYNSYVYTGNLTGSVATSYTSLVPYEEGLTLNATNYQTLASHAVSDGSYRQGPSGMGESVMCLSCHRAHASGWPSILRWNAPSATYLTVQGVYPGIDSTIAQAQQGEYNLGYLQAQVQRTFYDRPASVYASYQAQLCGKCHS